MERYFNTTSACDKRLHYTLPPEERLPGLDRLIDRRLYFVLYAPRRTGKTTAMWAFAQRLRDEGRAVAVYATLEASQGVDAVADAEPLWIRAIGRASAGQLAADLRPSLEIPAVVPGDRLATWLSAWCQQLAGQPLVLLLDEADVVTGPAMVSLLRQLRSGFTERLHERFPASVALIGLRDLRDYLVKAKDARALNPGSPFNVKAASLTLRGFTVEDVGRLVGQHTADTGQRFDPQAVERLWWWTRGQPFLVNALAGLCVDDLVPDRGQPITAAHVDQASQRLIRARTTHLDSLSERLRDPEIAAIILGEGAQSVDSSTRSWER
ncbi:MAG: ATP-binding protein, partial [Oligoflexia bacterium]|nr:ATP-binding protein [Oligoflexia bacterium]